MNCVYSSSLGQFLFIIVAYCAYCMFSVGASVVDARCFDQCRSVSPDGLLGVVAAGSNMYFGSLHVCTGVR